MTDDLVKRMHKWVDDLEHDCDHDLEFELSGEEAGDFARDICEMLARIEKLKAALRGVIAVADRDTPEFRFARKALEEKNG